MVLPEQCDGKDVDDLNEPHRSPAQTVDTCNMAVYAFCSEHQHKNEDEYWCPFQRIYFQRKQDCPFSFPFDFYEVQVSSYNMFRNVYLFKCAYAIVGI